MNSPARTRSVLANEVDPRIRQMYHRMMASWVVDLLKGPRTPQWSEKNPMVDEDGCPWRELYAGSILDD